MTNQFNSIKLKVNNILHDCTLEIKKNQNHYRLAEKSPQNTCIYFPYERGTDHYFQKFPLLDSAMERFTLELAYQKNYYICELYVLAITRNMPEKHLYKILIEKDFEELFPKLELYLEESINDLKNAIKTHAKKTEIFNMMIQNFQLKAFFTDKNQYWTDSYEIPEIFLKIFSNISFQKDRAIQIDFDSEEKMYRIIDGFNTIERKRLKDALLEFNASLRETQGMQRKIERKI